MGYTIDQLPAGSDSPPAYNDLLARRDVSETRKPFWTKGDTVGSLLKMGQAATIADLKAVDVTQIPDGLKIEVMGYSTQGDGGGGTYYYDAASVASDNGNTVIEPTAGAGAWLRTKVADDRLEVATMAALAALSVTPFTSGAVATVLSYSTLGDGGDGLFRLDKTASDTPVAGMILSATGGGRWFRLYTPRRFKAAWFGVKADGVTDDRAALVVAFEYAEAQGGGVVELPENRTCIMGSAGTGINLGAGVSIEGNGCLLHATSADVTPLQTKHDFTTRGTITANVAAGDVTFTLDSSAAFQAGDLVGVRLGDNAYDNAETKLFFVATVKAVPGATSVTLDTPAPAAMTVGSTQAANRQLYRFRTGDTDVLWQNCYIRNLRMKMVTTSTRSCISIIFARNCRLENLYLEDPGPGLQMAYCSDVIVDGLHVPRSNMNNGQASLGRGVNAYNCVNMTFNNVRLEACSGDFAFFESYCLGITATNWVLRDNWLAKTGTARGNATGIAVSQGSIVSFDNLLVEGSGSGLNVLSLSNEGYANLSNIRVETASKVKFIPLAGFTHGSLSLNGFSAISRRVKRALIHVPLSRSLTDANPIGVNLPRGFWIKFSYFASSITGITGFIIKGASNNDLTSSLVGGAKTNVSAYSNFGTDYSYNDPAVRYLGVYTNTTVPSGAFMTLDIEYIPTAEEDYIDSTYTKALQLFGASAGIPTAGPSLSFGTGAPTLAGPPGSVYLRTDGGAGATLYVRENGADTNWTAK